MTAKEHLISGIADSINDYIGNLESEIRDLESKVEDLELEISELKEKTK